LVWKDLNGPADRVTSAEVRASETHVMVGYLQIQVSSEAETFRLGQVIGRLLKPLDVVLLIGELGAGKTRLAKGIVSAATRVDPHDVVSPTFTLINRYDGTYPVFHADLYRLEDSAVDDSELLDSLEAGGALVVEWAEKIREFETDPLTIHIEYGEEDSLRKFLLEWRQDGSWEERMRTLPK
jgi:tRNA threonylcarbamoyladenosine biosynthesis protein TsaE